ncbi:MAG: hypothetical protein QNJ40_04925 [Xanthomonadales bacterium]|nr:hypothetical protein [Xanthomonadales bacterium]
MNILKSVIILALLAGAAGAQDQPAAQPAVENESSPARLIAMAAQAQAAEDYPAMERAAARLVQLRPQIGAYNYALAKAYALQDKKSEAYNTLLLLSGQGMSFDLDQDSDFDNLRGFELYGFIQDGFKRNLEPAGRVIREIPVQGDGLLIDGLAWDPKNKRLLAGSITTGSIFSVDADGSRKILVEASEENGLLGVFDLAVDPGRRSLWVASAAVPHYRDIKFQDAGRTGVFEFDLDTGTPKSRYELPVGQGRNVLSNLTVARDGSVYVANSSRPEVFRVDPEKRHLERVFHAPTFTSFRGLATSPDGRFLYFSDYEMGLFAVELGSSKAFQVRADPKVNLGGIDALDWYRDGLIMVQSGNSPNRVFRVALDGSGTLVTKAQPILVGQPRMDAPNEGIVADGEFLLVANSNSALYDPRSGKPLESVTVAPQILLALDPEAGWEE